MKLSAPISILAMDFSGHPFPLASKSGYLLICSSSNVNTVDTYMVLGNFFFLFFLKYCILF
ncbi:hypothetical protein Syun_031785 [Stephania yunnanensis]|uniref:Uncharacterized protein n=1 Tax=Stephania yunnanensis TaxID=152371 RepID=A0AAP0DVH2_9MAGN